MSNPLPQPTEDKLKLLVANGADCIDIAQSLIDKWKMPFIINKLPSGDYELRSAFTDGELWLQRFITVDPKTIEMKEDAIKMAATQDEVLIFGETGTGKEILAKSMIGSRSGQIKAVNCAGFPRELIESELFGSLKGSYTGSTSDNDGLILSASNGIMFFDEIGELPMDLQAKLLRVLQEKAVRKVGGKKEEKVNCKFVFATNRNLWEMVKAGLFRIDLYARLSTLELEIAPLRDRMCDIIPIIKSFPNSQPFLDKYGDDLVKGLFDLSMNVRSLQKLVTRFNVLGRLVIKK